jgi:hypothetical protein
MTTTVTYTEALIRKVIFRWWARFIGWHGFASILACGLLFAYTLFFASERWLIYGSLALWLFVTAMAASVLVVYSRRSLAKFWKMDDRTAEVTITPDGFRVKSSLAESNLNWRVIEAVWRFPEAWLIFVGKNTFMTLPIEHISHEDRERLCAMVTEHGGHVK